MGPLQAVQLSLTGTLSLHYLLELIEMMDRPMSLTNRVVGTGINCTSDILLCDTDSLDNIVPLGNA